MTTSIKSHAFFVGNLKHRIDAKTLDKSSWVKVIENKQSYKFLCSYFHKSHVDAMIEADGQMRPKFLNDVHHYQIDVNACIPLSIFDFSNSKLLVLNEYKLNIIGLHVYFMPLDITLFAVEIDDSGSDLNELIEAHKFIRNFPIQWEQFNDAFKNALTPIKELCHDGNLTNLITSGNKLKVFQILMVDQETYTDEHLYEIGTCSPFGSVGTNDNLAPSEEYYNYIIKENMIAPFKTWKSLSLMDTYTTLIKRPDHFEEEWGKYKITWIKSYYHFIFLRVLMQKTFLSSQNIQYRLNHSNTKIIRGLNRMEQYYFYDNISYNFLPDILNKQMANGMAIHKEKSELFTQIKEWDNKSTNTIMVILSVFAIFSISNNIYSVVKDIMHKDLPILLYIVSAIALICIAILIIRLIRRN